MVAVDAMAVNCIAWVTVNALFCDAATAIASNKRSAVASIAAVSKSAVTA